MSKKKSFVCRCEDLTEHDVIDAISMKDINSIPAIDYDVCISCGNCIGVCPGLALFIVKTTEDKGYVTLPYEFLPIPEKGQHVNTLDRKGNKIDTGVVQKIRKAGKTCIVTIEIEKHHVMDVRNIRV